MKDELGVALSVAQFGGKHPSAKPWKGEGPGVLAIVADYQGDTYRAVLHCPVSASDLRIARIPEEITEGTEDRDDGRRIDFTQTEGASQDYEVRYGKQSGQ